MKPRPQLPRDSRTTALRLLALATVAATGCSSDAMLLATLEKGPTRWVTHDPSRIVVEGDTLMVASTGDAPSPTYRCGLETWTLREGAGGWQPGQCLFKRKPVWIEDFVPENDGAYWAPTLLDARTLFYSVAAGFDGKNHCIGMARASGEAPALRWSDSGEPILCITGAERSDEPIPSAIDPSVFVDAAGMPWLVFGGGHIYATRLDPRTYRRVNGVDFLLGDPNDFHLANGPRVDSSGKPDEDLWVEAAYAFEHGGFVYLFVNWYACCGGADSTYEIRVGRARTIAGPFFDAAGRDMRSGGGTLVLDGDDSEIGPGHAGIFHYTDAAGTERFVLSYHYYTPDGEPWATIGARELTWDAGWPRVAPSPWNPADYWDAR